jgi:hypothetical protein
MGDDARDDRDARRDYAARLLILELLDHAGGRTTRDLQRTLPDIPQAILDASIAMLVASSVIVRQGDRLNPAPALVMIDRLHLIAI